MAVATADPVLEIAAQLRRVFGLYRLYGVAHEIAHQGERDLHQKLAEHLKGAGQLSLWVEPNYLKHGTKKLLEEEKKEESFTRVIYGDGVQSIAFLDGLSAEELGEYLRIWFGAVTRVLDPEHTFSTLVWERDFDNISTSFRPGLAEHGANESDAKQSKNRMSRLVDAVLSGEVTPGAHDRSVAVDSHALAVLTQVDALRELRPEDLTRTSEAERAPVHELQKSDKSALAAALSASRRGGGQRLLLALWNSLPLAGPAERAAVEELVTKVVRALIQQHRSAEVCRALVRIAEGARGVPTRQGALASFLTCLSDREVVAGVVALLEVQEEAADAQQLLAYLPAHLAEELLPALESGSRELRAKLVQSLIQKAPSAETLAFWLVEKGEPIAAAIFAIAEQLGAEHVDFVIRAALVHDDPLVRLRGLRAIKTEGVPEYRTLVISLLADTDLNAREQALSTLVRARDPEAAGLLESIVGDAGSPAEVMRMAIRAMGTVGGPRAVELLVTVLREHRDKELRRAAALALGRLDDSAAVKALEAEAKRLFVDRDVKEACKEALRRLGAKEP